MAESCGSKKRARADADYSRDARAACRADVCGGGTIPDAGAGISGQPIPGYSERGSQARPELAEVPMIHAASETTGPEEAREFAESPSPEPGRISDVTQQAVQNAVQNTVQKTVQKTVEKTLQNTVEKRTEHIIEKKIEKETEKKVQQTAEQAFQKAEGQKVLQTAMEQTLQKPAEQRTLQSIVENRVRDTVQHTAGYRMLQKAHSRAYRATAGAYLRPGTDFSRWKCCRARPWRLCSHWDAGAALSAAAAKSGSDSTGGADTSGRQERSDNPDTGFSEAGSRQTAVSRQTSPGQALETASMIYPEDREAKEQEASRQGRCGAHPAR